MHDRFLGLRLRSACCKIHCIRDLGIGQCVAQMVGAQLFNQRKEAAIPTLYGCVTTAERWQFLTLTQDYLTIDRQVYNYPNELDRILGILQFVLDRA